jgi:hypothetical protein
MIGPGSERLCLMTQPTAAPLLRLPAETISGSCVIPVAVKMHGADTPALGTFDTLEYVNDLRSIGLWTLAPAAASSIARRFRSAARALSGPAVSSRFSTGVTSRSGELHVSFATGFRRLSSAESSKALKRHRKKHQNQQRMIPFLRRWALCAPAHISREKFLPKSAGTDRKRGVRCYRPSEVPASPRPHVANVGSRPTVGGTRSSGCGPRRVTKKKLAIS